MPLHILPRNRVQLDSAVRYSFEKTSVREDILLLRHRVDGGVSADPAAGRVGDVDATGHRDRLAHVRGLVSSVIPHHLSSESDQEVDGRRRPYFRESASPDRHWRAKVQQCQQRHL